MLIIFIYLSIKVDLLHNLDGPLTDTPRPSIGTYPAVLEEGEENEKEEGEEKDGRGDNERHLRQPKQQGALSP